MSGGLSGLTFTQVANVFRELQMSTTQGGGEEAHGLLEGRIEAGDAIENRVPQQLCRGRPSGSHTEHDNNKHAVCYARQNSWLLKCFEKSRLFILCIIDV